MEFRGGASAPRAGCESFMRVGRCGGAPHFALGCARCQTLRLRGVERALLRRAAAGAIVALPGHALRPGLRCYEARYLQPRRARGRLAPLSTGMRPPSTRFSRSEGDGAGPAQLGLCVRF